ncbi:hypothetical protein ASF57_12045 [Methylobacterium sp. Leaf117]|nr:hypothetical protein ASF57_12045 [Methylobacterium sp. Leaf117]
MALSGVHIACGYIGGKSGLNNRSLILSPPVWSQTMAAAGTTDKGAPAVAEDTGDPSFEIRSSADIYVAIGAAPNASTGTRIFVPANETRNIFCSSGDKLAWIAA